MRLIGHLVEAGIYFDAFNTSYTVPPGTIDSSLEFQTNDSTLSDNFGSIQLCVELTNSAVEAWEVTFNLVPSNEGWTPRDMGIYTIGTGFQDGTVNYSGTIFRGIDIQIHPAAPFFLTRIRWMSDCTPGAGAGNVAAAVNTPGAYFFTTPLVTGPTEYDSGVVSEPATADVYIDNIVGAQAGSDPGGGALLTQITINGQGYNPF